MSCSLDSECSDDSFFNEDMYLDIRSRPSLFDPLMTISQTYSDSAQTGPKKIRFVTMMTDACSRVSGRTASSPNLAKKYWEYINSKVYSKWMTVDSGIDKNTGVVTEDVCDLRDYPTIDELTMNLSNSSMGVAVVFTGRENDTCADIEDYTKGEFWSVVGEAADNLSVPFAFSSASERSIDIADKLFAGIQSIFSDICDGSEVTGMTTVAEGSDDFTTVPSGIKTTVPEGSDGPSATTVPEGSDDVTTVPSGIKTTVPEGSDDFTTVPTGIKTTVPEGSHDFTTVPSSTLPIGLGCKDGIPIGIDLEWFHIHDSSISMKKIHSESATALKSVVDEVNERLLSENTSDRLSFSLIEAHDKSDVCSLFGYSCSCTDVPMDELSLT